jgi:hypothetical protein
MLDIFNNDAFSMVSLTASINKMPYIPRRIGEMGLFRAEGVTTTIVAIQMKDGTLELIQSKPRGGPADILGPERPNIRPFIIPHLPKDSTVIADSVQNVRTFGSESQLESVQAVVNERLRRLRQQHEVTHERHRAGAIQGIVLDADDSVMLNLFDEFGVTQATATIDPDPTTDNHDALRGEITGIMRQIESATGADVGSGYHAFCGPVFFDALRADVGVTETLRYADPQSLLQQQAFGRRFMFAGVVWEEYRGSVGGTPFFPEDAAFVFPVGTDIFRAYFAPADTVAAVNTIGLPFYAQQERMEFDKGIKIHSQSNPLFINTRPEAVVKVTIAT